MELVEAMELAELAKLAMTELEWMQLEQRRCTPLVIWFFEKSALGRLRWHAEHIGPISLSLGGLVAFGVKL